jgi:hypothetical protein
MQFKAQRDAGSTETIELLVQITPVVFGGHFRQVVAVSVDALAKADYTRNIQLIPSFVLSAHKPLD